MVGVSRHKLLYAGWINNKVTTVEHRELSQYCVINCHGKEYEKEYIYVHHFAVQQN